MGRAREIADLIGGTTPDIILKTSDGAILNLQTSDTTVTADSVLGAINFQAPDEASGTDSILIASKIEAIAEDTFAADNNATKLVFSTGASAAASERMSISSTGLVTISRSDNAENLSLVSTDADASVGPTLRMDRQSASAADGDLLGKINFVGHNDAGTPEDIAYAGITAIINDASDGTEDGKLAINTIVAGTERSRLFIDAGETVFNEDSVDVDFRVESNGNVNALFVDAGTGDGVVICGSNTVVGRFGAPLEVTTHGGTNRGGLMISNFQAAATDSIIDFNKSRNNTVGSHTVVQSGDNIGSIIFRGSDGSAFVDCAAIAGQIDSTPGSSDMPGRLSFFTTPDGGTGGTERIRVSTAGLISFHKTSFDETADGVHFDPSGLVTITRANGTAFVVNRQTADGTIVDFRQANSTEGFISVSGSTVSYNGFSGLHESSGIANNVDIGTVVSTIDELDVYPSKQKNTKDNSEENHPKAGQTRADHAKIKISDSVGDKRVYGVLQSYDVNGKPLVASVGIGSIKVTGACEGGDLLESNGDGTAKVQSDDIVRSKTLGKVTIGNSSTDVKLVSCVLYCG